MRDFRQTKIVCTLGPASSKPEQIEQLAAAGMNIARLNMSHGDHASHLQVLEAVQKLNERLNHPIALLLDLQGPAIRTGDRLAHLSLEVGQEFHVTVGPTANPEEKTIHVDYQDMVQQFKVGDRITVDNGLINLEVLEVLERDLRCRVLDGGVLGSRKHINLPGVRINLPSISAQDVADIRFAAEHDVDFLAVSFVRSAEAVRDARRIIDAAGGHPMRIIAKIENQEGIDNLDEIIDAADGIMVARGDLGVEMEFEMLPVAQRDMVRRCAIAGKPVIVATHLLESMIDNPMPTRAEVTVGRPQSSWTRIKGESDVTRRWGYGSVEAGEGSWVGADGGSPEGDRSRRRRGGDGVGGLGAGTTVEREPETGCGVAAAA